MVIYDYEDERYERKKERKSKFYEALDRVINGRNLKNIATEIGLIELFDIYHFLKRYGRIKYSSVAMNKYWGPYFKEAVILHKDFIISIQRDPIGGESYYTIYHKKESEINKFVKTINEWMAKNSIFMGKQFTFPFLEKPDIKAVSFINDSTKSLLEENTILFFRKLMHLRKEGIKTKRGIILYGSPGNGKTSICRYISKNLPCVTRIWVTDWHMRPYHVSTLFTIARNLSPSIIFLEDIDTVGISRSMTGRINPILGKLLNEMDGIQDNDGIVVVATTNNIDVIDEALANRPGRFDLKIHIGNPHPRIIKKITGNEDDITLAEAFRRKHDRIYYEKILGRKYNPPSKRSSVHYIG